MRWVLLLAAALTLPHLLSLRQPYFMDEGPILANVIEFFHHRTLIPVDTRYPTLFAYVAAPGIAAQALLLAWLGDTGSVAATVGYLARFDPRALIWPARGISLLALLGTAALLAVFLARRVGRVGGAAAGLALLASPALLQYAAYGLPDVLTLLLAAAALVFSVRFAEGAAAPGVSWDALLAAAFAGLAASSKYTGAAAATPVAAALGLRLYRGDTSVGRGLVTGGLCGLAAAATFLAGSPGWILATDRFVDGLRYEMRHAATGHLGTSGIPVLGQLQLLVTGAPVLTLAAGVGVALWLRSRDALGSAALALILGTLALSAQSQKQSLHYLYPLFPALACFLAVAAQRLWGRRPRVAAALGAVCALALGVNAWSHGLRYSQPNSTAAAAAWIHRNVPPQAAVALDWAYVPELYSAADFAHLARSELAAMAPEVIGLARRRHPTHRTERIQYSAEWLHATPAEFLVTSDACFGRYFRDGLFTGRVPDPGTPLHAEFMARKRFYSQLFESPEWRLVAEMDTGNGPRTLIYARDGIQAERTAAAGRRAPAGAGPPARD